MDGYRLPPVLYVGFLFLWQPITTMRANVNVELRTSPALPQIGLPELS
jgi:hypothetical protein